MANLEHPLSKQLLNCSVCGSVFKYQSKLTRHLLVHSKAKLYKCKYCDSAFSLSHNLKVHLRIHLGIKPFKCSFPGCDKSFTQSNNMRVHYKTHKPVTGLKKLYNIQISGESKEYEESTVDEYNIEENMKEEENEFELETDLSESSFNF